METHKLGEGLSVIWVDDELDKHSSKMHKLQEIFGFKKIYEATSIKEIGEAFKQAHADGANIGVFLTDLQLSGENEQINGSDVLLHLKEGLYDKYYPDARNIPSRVMTNNYDYRVFGIYKGDLTRLTAENITENPAGIAVTNLICAYRGIALPQSSPSPHPVNPPEGFAGFEEAKHVTRARERLLDYVDHGDWNLRLLKRNAADRNKPRTPE